MFARVDTTFARRTGSTMAVAFVEEKRPDPRRIASLLEASARANQWANFGPLVEQLGQRIGEIARLPEGRVAVPSANGTTALIAAAAVADTKRGRRHRWAISAFGFPASWIGPFADALIVDCRPDGTFDLDALDRVPDDVYDGILATNIYGVLASLDEVVAFARAGGKTLVIDNAAGLLGFRRTDQADILETLSFHHTKPHGFGEGGALILDADLAPIARKVMNFGIGLPSTAAHAFCNGKMSEPAAAYVLDRLAALEDWAPLYRGQAERLARIGRRLGLAVVAERLASGDATPNYVGFVLPSPRTLPRLMELVGGVVTARKYYPPPPGSFPNARALYDRVLCLPCHPGMAVLGDATIGEVLTRAVADRTDRC